MTPVVFQAKYGERIDVAPHIAYPFDRVDSPDTGEIYLLQGIVDIFTQAREKIGVPILINAGYRTANHQAELRREGLKASRISPHEHGTAFDLIIQYVLGSSFEKRCYTLIKYLSDAARVLGLREYLRYGCREYGFSFVHVDIVPILFDPNWKALALDKLDEYLDKFYPYGTANPNPDDWKPGVTW